jgi:hypothetical protein
MDKFAEMKPKWSEYRRFFETRTGKSIKKPLALPERASTPQNGKAALQAGGRETDRGDCGDHRYSRGVQHCQLAQSIALLNQAHKP